ncbi:primase C-terminal domain-containing protein [Thalassobacillus pellis]|uniref:primase C-terminal domain-containing protein n=1 Tax=Thalassobacillus pellis TaxID=748008 RepID=UPI001960D9A3|nr:primase C-terminal domain-containing protein [Thalassobacillus pellis]MBM7554420.1 hypothetical protein [Thalassobacillus pellis]
MKMEMSNTAIMQFMTHNSLRVYKPKGSKAALPRKVAYEKEAKKGRHNKGVVFVSPSKEALIEGKGHIVTSYETLEEQEGTLTHWTPNTFRGGTYYDFKHRVLKGHTRDNLKQINVIAFDIDTKEVDLYALFLGCQELGLPQPNLLLETPRGYQGFFVLETPFYIHRNSDFKALRVAERLAENVLHALKTYVAVDPHCTPFGFYRIPRTENVVFFDPHPASTAALLKWSKEYETTTRRRSFQVVYANDQPARQQTQTAWYQALLQARHITAGHYTTSRNNTIFTLALANFQDEVPFEVMYDELDQFNSQLEYPLSLPEFERIVKSAYSGRYKGVKRAYVEALLELWTDGKAVFPKTLGWYKFKKKREARERSHYEEWEQDVLAYLHQRANAAAPYVESSLRQLAGTLQMAVSSLKEVLKRSNQLRKQTVGKGRGAVTTWTSRSLLLQHWLHLRKQQQQDQQLQWEDLLALFPEGQSLSQAKAVTDLLPLAEMDDLYRAGSSPPKRNTS